MRLVTDAVIHVPVLSAVWAARLSVVSIGLQSNCPEKDMHIRGSLLQLKRVPVLVAALCLLVSGCADRDPLLASDPLLRIGLVVSNEEVGEREDGTGAFRTHCLESH